MIALSNCTIVRLWPALVESGVDVLIDGPRIAGVGRGLAGKSRAERSLDCSGKLVMPGLVCSHDHFYSGLSRGIMAKIAPSTDFVSTLANLWWRLDRAIDEDILRASGTICALEALKAGVTSVVDHHASPGFIAGSLDVLKGCFEKAGLRGVLCFETTDRNGGEGLEAGIGENRRFANLVEREKPLLGDGRLVEAMIGGHAPFTIPDSGLRALGDLVRETGRGFHIHCSEDSFDASFAHRFQEKDPLARLDGFGLLDDRTIIAHGVYLSAEERALLNARGAFLAHNARSNMNNHVGYNDGLPEVKNAALGTDGIGSDVMLEAKFAYFKHRDAGGPCGPGDFARLLQNGNRIIAQCFGRPFGCVEKGGAADLTIMGYDSPTPLAAENVGGHLVFGMGSRDVETVIVGGRIVMENRAFSWDIAAEYAEARTQAKRLWNRMDSL